MNAPQTPNTYRSGPDENGRFGLFGGRFVAETLMPLVLSLEQSYEAAKVDPGFQNDMASFLKHYIGRPSPLYFAERMTEHLGGAKIYFKRDELNHTGAHKINNCIGQILLAMRMARRGSSPRPARASTASPQRRSAPASGWSASSIWARSMSRGRPATSSA